MLKTLGVGGLDRFGGQPALALFCSYHCVISGKWREGGEILPNSGKFDSCVDKTQSWILKVTASLSLLCQHPCDLLSPGTQPRVNSGRPPASHGSFRRSWGTRGVLVTLKQVDSAASCNPVSISLSSFLVFDERGVQDSFVKGRFF